MINVSDDWHAVAAVDDVDDDDVVQVKVRAKRIAVYNLGGDFYATSDVCTHEYACLSEGFIIDGNIECPLHQGRFDIRSGKPKGAPVSVPLKTYPVKVEAGQVFVRLD